jgi:glycosyltransferase involved in cell wall biosynthesis
MNPKGGTEIQRDQLIAQLDEKDLEGINLFTSICHPDLIKKDKINILWQQLSYDQPNVKLMADRRFVDSVDFFVYNSHWCFEKFRTYFKIPEYKSFVIKNATHPFDKPAKIGNKTKIIFTSTPWRGLSVLILAIQHLNKVRDDFEVDVYSSTQIYGDKFKEITGDKYDGLYERCKNTKNMNYIGYAPNEEIRKAVANAHILAYPSIFEETSCIAVIEAMMAGCRVVTTNYGALYETCADFADMIEYEPNHAELAKKFASQLNWVIHNLKEGNYKEDLDLQVKYYEKNYSWKTRIEEWRNFLQYARTRKKAS